MIRAALALFGLLLVAAGVLWSLEIPLSSPVVFRDCQPATIDYKSYGPYCGGLVEKHLVGKKQCELRIVKEPDSVAEGYGHGVTVIEAACPANPALSWTESGVTLEYDTASGRAHLAVPRAAFVGGR